MAKEKASTRRAFLKVGALAAAPLTAAASAEAMAVEGDKARLLRLQDEAAVRDLHQAWLRRINAGEGEAAARLFVDPRRAAVPEGLSAAGADHAAAPDRIELAADGRTASGRFHCVVETQTPLPQDCTLAQMAYAQGSGVVRRSERRVIEAAYVNAGDRWAIARLDLAPAQAVELGARTLALKARLDAMPSAVAQPMSAARSAVPLVLLYKVMGKMSAVLSVRGAENVILKCDPHLAEVLREQYTGVGHRSHLDRRFWISVDLDSDVPPEAIVGMADASYALVCSSLTRAQKAQLASGVA